MADVPFFGSVSCPLDRLAFHHAAASWHIVLGWGIQGGRVASCDAKGVVRLWDVRKMAELHTTPLAPAGKAANCCRFDASGKVLAVSSDAGKVACLDLTTMEVLKELAGHTGAVHGAVFGPQSNSLLSVGSDGTLRMWGEHA